MNEKLETKIWNWLWHNSDTHPDELPLNWDSIESLKKSIQAEGISLEGFPEDDSVECSFEEYCKVVAEESCFVDKAFAYKTALATPQLKKLWESCEEPSSPINSEELGAQVKRLGYKINVTNGALFCNVLDKIGLYL